jgi:hypothetical protein
MHDTLLVVFGRVCQIGLHRASHAGDDFLAMITSEEI